MITITAKRNHGDAIDMTVEMKGSGIDLVLESLAVVTEIPKKLHENDPNLLTALRELFETYVDSEEALLKEVIDGNKQS